MVGADELRYGDGGRAEGQMPAGGRPVDQLVRLRDVGGEVQQVEIPDVARLGFVPGVRT